MVQESCKLLSRHSTLAPKSHQGGRGHGMPHNLAQNPRHTHLPCWCHDLVEIERQIFICGVADAANSDSACAESGCFVQHFPTLHFHRISHSSELTFLRRQTNHAVCTIECIDDAGTMLFCKSNQFCV